ncbi:MAG TPA: ABC-F family ATP-binding cassette domain-containing protein [Solirubrobacteraceae bacterium]|jgi:ATP-binding cassette subfamily F protein 3|nr:ABC-F family ATP-binding cassette domain-containing protein [Solirubrobacteraceae bacterium]
MALLIASDMHKDMVGVPLLRGVSFKLERRERMTIAGRNGAGKTTLLRMLAGETSIDRGELSVAKGVRVVLHDQRPPRERGLPLREYLLSGCAEELAIEGELAQLEARMAEGEADEATLTRYAGAQARLEARGGYLWRDRATSMAHGLGFRDADLDRPLDTFSGGQLTRASLARALATAADVLLLDEPTNHLDIESLEWLEQTLVSLDSAIVLVAHDRWFLEAVGTAVLELYGAPPTHSRFFAGTWHNWRREQAAREIALGKAIDKQQAEIERMERFIERFRYKASKAKQAQSRVKKLSKIERIERDPKDEKGLEFQFAAPERTGRVIFELSGGRVEIGEPPIVLLDQAELWLEREEHVSLVGPNGTGKTTLIETLAGQRELAAGKLSTGHNVKVGYLSQHAEELGAGGPAEQSVLDAAQRATGLSPGKARALLGRFLFSGEEAEKPLSGLSGGERRRLSLAVLVQSGANVLILDEPTNHLDIESREALEDALRSFPGAVLLVSHDRALLDAVGTRTVAVEDGSLRSYEGGWPEYVRIRDERRAEGSGSGSSNGSAVSHAGRKSRDVGPHVGRHGGAHAPLRPTAHVPSGTADDSGSANGSAPGAAKSKSKAKPKGPSKNRLNDQQKAEKAIEAAEASLKELEAELADPAAWATRYESAKSEARHTAARRAVEEAYARLEALID